MPPDAFEASIIVGDRTYVSLQQISEHFNGSCGYERLDQPLGIQPVVLRIGSAMATFENGGDSVCLGNDNEKSQPLNSMLLVIGDQHYAEAGELAELLGGRYQDQTFTIEQGILALQPKTYVWSTKPNRVQALRCENSAVRFHHSVSTVNPGISGFRSIIATGSEWHVRRTFRFNGRSVALLHEAQWPFDSVLVASKDISENASLLVNYGTPWLRLKKQFQERRESEVGLCHGNRANLEQSVCLTCDFCWSLRPLEKRLKTLFTKEIEQGQHVSFVAFMCGRWMDQHPQEMQQLIDWQESGQYQIDWGLHSYDHPKYGEFLNAYDEAALIDDTLRNEVAMLEWGVVPSVFYRFPGLVHDHTRFATILSLDLLSIDCESWMALVNEETTHPFSKPIDAGSIILVHANGNEPEGLPPLKQWRESNSSWQFKSLRYFLN